MHTGWKQLGAAALALAMMAGTAGAYDIGGFASTNSGSKGLAAGQYNSSLHRGWVSTGTTGSISPDRSMTRRPPGCPPRPKPGALRTQGGNSGTTINPACPSY
ncbi:hypothetical protein QTL95_14970 [Rhizobium sp. S152]|uniref:hypothetical protein n=1 Tax=Rhizobium sp. S152 TaxID=3055038 RepID=UPI0025A9ECB9|nr:hypothetical protein [Rhizobium sp. S152]MDM9627208.1 hypothetical protein [Rhizobium sp. S152]